MSKEAQNTGFTFSPENISTITKRPIDDVKRDLGKVRGRRILVESLMENETVNALTNGDKEKLTELLKKVAATLERKSSFLSWLGNAGNMVLRPTKAVLGNRWVQLALVLAAGYIGYKNFPSWDQVMSVVQRLRGLTAATAATTGLSAPAAAAPAVTENLVSGGVASTTSVLQDVPVGEIIDALEASPGADVVPEIAASR